MTNRSKILERSGTQYTLSSIYFYAYNAYIQVEKIDAR